MYLVFGIWSKARTSRTPSENCNVILNIIIDNISNQRLTVESQVEKWIKKSYDSGLLTLFGSNRRLIHSLMYLAAFGLRHNTSNTDSFLFKSAKVGSAPDMVSTFVNLLNASLLKASSKNFYATKSITNKTKVKE
jgi:hypothetical protein